MPAEPPTELISLPAAAERMGISRQALWLQHKDREKKANGFPEPVGIVGKTIVFRADELMAWREAWAAAHPTRKRSSSP